MKKIIILLFALFCLFATLFYKVMTLSVDNVVTIGVTKFVDHPALDKTYAGIIDTLKNYKNINIIHDNAQGNFSTAGLIAQKFVGEGVNAIITISTPSTKSAINAVKGTSIPIFFASVTDPVGADLLKNPDYPEGQVTGCSNFTELKPQLELFQSIIPNLKRLGVLYNSSESNSVIMVERIKQVAGEMGIVVISAAIQDSNEIAMATQRLVSLVDAFFVSNDNTVLSAFSTHVKIATAAQKAVFVSDTDLVNQGALAALGPNQYQIGVITAQLVGDYLAGKSIKQLAVRYPTDPQLYLNQTQAKRLDISFSKNLLSKSKNIL